MTRTARTTSRTLLPALLMIAAVGCSSSNGAGTGGAGGTPTTGAGGTDAGGTTGGGGTAAGGAVGAGGEAAFVAVNPCNSEAAYTIAANYPTTGNTIEYGGPNFVYDSMCLKVAVGTAVTFSPLTDDDSFTVHWLTPSSMRGTMPNPITFTNTGTTATFTFPNRGYFAYFCGIHGNDSGNYMAGVIWVQ